MFLTCRTEKTFVVVVKLMTTDVGRSTLSQKLSHPLCGEWGAQPVHSTGTARSPRLWEIYETKSWETQFANRGSGRLCPAGQLTAVGSTAASVSSILKGTHFSSTRSEAEPCSLLDTG